MLIIPYFCILICGKANCSEVIWCQKDPAGSPSIYAYSILLL